MHPQKTSCTSSPTLVTYSAERKECCPERLQARSRSREMETIKSKVSNPSASKGSYVHNIHPRALGTRGEIEGARQP